MSNNLLQAASSPASRETRCRLAHRGTAVRRYWLHAKHPLQEMEVTTVGNMPVFLVNGRDSCLGSPWYPGPSKRRRGLPEHNATTCSVVRHLALRWKTEVYRARQPARCLKPPIQGVKAYARCVSVASTNCTITSSSRPTHRDGSRNWQPMLGQSIRRRRLPNLGTGYRASMSNRDASPGLGNGARLGD